MWKVNKSAKGESGIPGGAGPSTKRERTVWIWTERLLLVFGLALLAAYGAARIESILGSRAALKKFADLDSSAITTASRNDGEDAGSSQDIGWPEADFSLWDAHRVRAYKESVAGQSGAPLAVLRISKINLEAPLLDGTDDLTLNHAVGRIAGTARPGEQGNIGIAGHRDGFFRGLKDVGVGDAIELKTLKGTDTYVVDQIQIVTPDKVDVLQPRSVPSLTLVTCYPFYFFGSAPKRYIVTASLTREIHGGSENSTLSPLTQTSSSKRRNNEQAE
jgi:sortase A